MSCCVKTLCLFSTSASSIKFTRVGHKFRFPHQIDFALWERMEEFEPFFLGDKVISSDATIPVIQKDCFDERSTRVWWIFLCGQSVILIDRRSSSANWSTSKVSPSLKTPLLIRNVYPPWLKLLLQLCTFTFNVENCFGSHRNFMTASNTRTLTFLIRHLKKNSTRKKNHYFNTKLFPQSNISLWKVFGLLIWRIVINFSTLKYT